MTTTKTTKTISAYNRNANDYTAKFNDYSTYKTKIIAFHDSFIQKGARILDLGCGPGNNITTIKSRDDSCQFTGIDLSEKLLDIARTTHPSCTFLHRNICHLEASVRYNTVLASFCIVHLNNEETEEILHFISDSLLTGGSCYLSFMEGSTSGFEKTSFSNEEIYFNYYEVQTVTEMLKRSGLTPKVISKEDYPENDGSTTSDVFIFAIKG